MSERIKSVKLMSVNIIKSGKISVNLSTDFLASVVLDWSTIVSKWLYMTKLVAMNQQNSKVLKMIATFYSLLFVFLKQFFEAKFVGVYSPVNQKFSG